MIQLIRLTALVSLVFVAFSAIGRTSTTTAFTGAISDQSARACVADSAPSFFGEAIGAVDYAEAVLIANGEKYYGQSADEIRADVAALPAYNDDDGVSAEEVFALELLLEYGRQLAYATATEELERQIEAAPASVRVASAEDGISYDLLQTLRGGC